LGIPRMDEGVPAHAGSGKEVAHVTDAHT
jgi:hypothetical protein